MSDEQVPDHWPRPGKETLSASRIGADEDLDEYEGMDDEAIEEAIASKEARAQVRNIFALALNPHLLQLSSNFGKPHIPYFTHHEWRISKMYQLFPYVPPFGRTFGDTSFCRLYFILLD